MIAGPPMRLNQLVGVLFTAGSVGMTPVVLAVERQAKTPPPAHRQQSPATPGTPGTRDAKPPATAPSLDLKALEQRLRNTKAIGIFTKITLKNQVDDLLDAFEAYYDRKSKRTIKDLRQSYDLLLMKVLSLLQEKDQPLASEIVASREAIWALLADKKTFATLRA
jgi:hypothetical protein